MRLIVVSNRLPVIVEKSDSGWSFRQSAGGLVQGLSASIGTILNITGSKDYTWIGWPGTSIEQNLQSKVKTDLLNKFNAYPVFMSEEEMEKFYLGFCNSTIWPLFHYMTTWANYDSEQYKVYKEVNEKFAETVIEIAHANDIIWINDYHLMMIPELLRKHLPEAKIGFFLHIPFPSFEIIRLLPKKWRESLLKGLLGSDLVGFHTFAYQVNFLRSIRRILGLENNLGYITLENRTIKTGVYPIGIDFEKYNKATENETIQKGIESIKETIGKRKVILSIDRLDYSKGILNRLRAYEEFLKRNKEWHEKVTFVMIVVPSRIGVYRYQKTKENIDSLVGNINGQFGNIQWTPIVYQFKNLPFEELSAVYNIGDVILVTPFADGMNLVSKEYIASQKDYNGVLILSECAGAFEEMRDTLVINPNDIDEMSSAIKRALEMDYGRKVAINQRIQKYLKKYDIKWWTEKFIGELIETHGKEHMPRYLSDNVFLRIHEKYKSAKKRLFLLDYDGTLQPFNKNPNKAFPHKKLVTILKKLSKDLRNEIVIISGRDKQNLEDFMKDLPISLSAEHGVFIKEHKRKWNMMYKMNTEWKEDIRDILELYAERLPGSLVEEKDYSVVLHYRNASKKLASSIIPELYDILSDLTANTDLLVKNINMGLEIKNMYINKGLPVLYFTRKHYDFIFCAGDDTIDEEMFEALPEDAISVKVGSGGTRAKYYIKDTKEMLNLLEKLGKS